MRFLAFLILALLVVPAPLVAQQDTASLKEIRQRASYAVSRAENMGDEVEALVGHLRQLIDALSVHIGDLPIETKPEPESEPEEEVPPVELPPLPGLLYSDGFEDVPVGQRVFGRGANGFQWRGGYSTIVVSDDHAYSGTKSLRFDYPGEPDPTEDSTREQRFILGPEGRTDIAEIWVEFMVRVPDNFEHRAATGATNSKLMLLWGEEYSGPNDAQVGANYQRSTNTRSHIIVSSLHGDDARRGTQQNQTVKGTIFDEAWFGEWIRLRFHYRLGTGSPGDPTIVRVWRDNTLISEMPQNWNSIIEGGRNYLRNGYIFGWSNSGYTEDTNFYVDDFRIWTADPGWTF